MVPVGVGAFKGDRMPESRVLLVEDSATDALLMGVYLRRDGRFRVARVETLAAACDVLYHGDGADVVVLDLNLPDSMGLETFTALHERFPDTPVVILSGQEDEESAVAAVRRGAQDYVPKAAVDAPLLVRSLRYAMERNAWQLAERRNILIERDLATARAIQQHMLPHEPPRIDGFDIASVYRPADATGGDFFDYIELAGGTWDVLVADVSSHGFAPSLIMVDTRRVLRTCARLHEDIGECLTIANQAVAEDTLPPQFVTLFYARFDPRAHTLRYATAGHQAWVLNASGGATALTTPGIPLGLMHAWTYEAAASVALEPGGIVLLMTDGAWEAAAPDGEQFTRQRIFDFIHQHRDQSAAEILGLVLEAITDFSRPTAPKDDVTLVLVKVAT